MIMLTLLVFAFSHIVSTESNESAKNQKRFLLDGKPIIPELSLTPYRSTANLTFTNRSFYLEGKPFRIISGSFHYFRSVPEYWRTILLKMKACGLNTVQTYVPWNLHEEYPDEFNFQGMLNLRKFIQTAKDVGLYVIFRPGPFICAEWEFGGLPAWLLKDDSMKVRSNYLGYTKPVERYFNRLIKEVVDLQYSRGGPIIAVQVENEFGSYSNETEHLLFLKKLLQKNGIRELFFTSDGFFNNTHTGMDRAPFYTEALPTANFQDIKEGYRVFNRIRNLSNDFPLMVTEFWSGWFDQWLGGHHTVSSKKFGSTLEKILEAGASVNFYMFYGGTTFGFMPGANWDLKSLLYYSDVTSYDYDAPLSETGDITKKYNVTRSLIQTYASNSNSSVNLPNPPADFVKEYYGKIPVKSYMDWNSLKDECNISFNMTSVVPMEKLPLHNGTYGQNFGYILYTTNIGNGSILNFTSIPRDRAQVFVDGMQVGVIESWLKDLTMVLPKLTSQRTRLLEILVENRGRVNFMTMGSNVLNEQRKGLLSDVLLDNTVLQNWSVYPLEFSSAFINRVKNFPGWRNITTKVTLPAMFSTKLHIQNTPKDTFLWMRGWGKGIVFLNGFNLGRYWNYGPTQTLYIPSPLLRTGDNEVLIFETDAHGEYIVFTNTPMLFM